MNPTVACGTRNQIQWHHTSTWSARRMAPGRASARCRRRPGNSPSPRARSTFTGYSTRTRARSFSGSSLGIWYVATYAHICSAQTATSRARERGNRDAQCEGGRRGRRGDDRGRDTGAAANERHGRADGHHPPRRHADGARHTHGAASIGPGLDRFGRARACASAGRACAGSRAES